MVYFGSSDTPKLTPAIAAPLRPAVEPIVQETVEAIETITASPKKVVALVPKRRTSPTWADPVSPKEVAVPVTTPVP